MKQFVPFILFVGLLAVFYGPLYAVEPMLSDFTSYPPFLANTRPSQIASSYGAVGPTGTMCLPRPFGIVMVCFSGPGAFTPFRISSDKCRIQVDSCDEKYRQ